MRLRLNAPRDRKAGMRLLYRLVSVLFLVPAVAGAQSVRGIVTDSASGAVLRGVVVALVDASGSEVRRALTNDAGEYRLDAPTAGTFRVRTLRLGFRPSVSAPVTIAAGSDAALPIMIAGVPFSLDTLRVAERAACELPDPARSTYAVWEQVRTAASAAQVTAASRVVNARVVTYRRVLEPVRERVVGQSAGVSQGLTARPWNSLAPDSLRGGGYVHRRADGGATYYAPDLAVILSDEFIEDHCLRLSDDSDGERLGIEFEPTRERRNTPEIRGTVWLDRRTNELREMEFRYVNVDRELTFGRSGGELHFARMDNGSFVISKWNIRMPQLGQHVVPQPGMRMGGATTTEVRVSELLIEGGELAAVTRASDTLWTRRTLLKGRVVDSTNGRAIANARVALQGGAMPVTTDGRGEFTIANVTPGEISIAISRPELEAIGMTHLAKVVILDDSTTHLLRVPRPRRTIAGATLSGTILDAVNGRPMSDVEVAMPSLSKVAFTNDSGGFRLEGIATGRHPIVLRRVGYRLHSDTIAFTENQQVERAFVMNRVLQLDTVAVVEAYSPRGFEENRRLGLGVFFTRAQLAKLENQTMASIFGQVPNVQMIRTVGSATYVASLRGRESRRGEHDIGGGHGTGAPPPPACYSLVYVDNQVMYDGRDGQVLFNLNKISPDRVEAIEYYASGTAGMPIRYMGPKSGCGVLVIHTRRSK